MRHRLVRCRFYHVTTECKDECGESKIRGAMAALEEVLEWCKLNSELMHTSLTELSSLCSTMLRREEHPPDSEEPAAVPSPMRRRSVVQFARPDAARGWESADTMYTDADFKSGCLAFTHFFKGEVLLLLLLLLLLLFAGELCLIENSYRSSCVPAERTKEIRLACVCGFRDALTDLLNWARTTSGSLAPDINGKHYEHSSLHSRAYRHSVCSGNDHCVF